MGVGGRYECTLLQEARLPVGNSNQRSDVRQVKKVSTGGEQQSFECSSVLPHFEETVFFKPQLLRILHTNSIDFRASNSLSMSL